jgi:hypothetical protein
MASCLPKPRRLHYMLAMRRAGHGGVWNGLDPASAVPPSGALCLHRAPHAWAQLDAARHSQAVATLRFETCCNHDGSTSTANEWDSRISLLSTQYNWYPTHVNTMHRLCMRPGILREHLLLLLHQRPLSDLHPAYTQQQQQQQQQQQYSVCQQNSYPNTPSANHSS